MQKDDPLRIEILEYIRTYKAEHDSKYHTVEGLVLNDDGYLECRDDLYTEAIYRGKIETRTRSAKKALEELKSQLDLLQVMGKKQQACIDNIDPNLLKNRIGEGEPVSDEQFNLLSKIGTYLLTDKSKTE